MKTFFLVLVALLALTGFSACDMAGDEDSKCGPMNELNTTMYYHEGNGIADSNYWGIEAGDTVKFEFLTPDWVTEEGLCSKEHINVLYTITLNADSADALKGLSMKGHIIVGLMDYPVLITKTNSNTFEGTGASIGLAGWGPYDDSGIGYIWGYVFIRFKSLGSKEADQYALFHALRKVQLDIDYNKPKSQ
jgi:hypothetical protein